MIRRTRFVAITLLLSLSNGVGTTHADEPKRPKVLIEFGWDEPDTAYLRENVAKIAESPFDGCVFHVATKNADGTVDNLAWKAWGRRVYLESEVAKAVEDLKTTGFGRFHQNFLRINTTPADLDWFDDHSAVKANLTLAAKIAKAGGCRGVLLDTEQYQGQLFHFAKQTNPQKRDWEMYAKQVHRRGAETMDALQKGMPGLTVLLTFGPSYVYDKAEKTKVEPKATEYGLLLPFVEGMATAIAGGSRLIDGHEPSYGYREPAEFDRALARIRKGPRSLEAGFGIWLDYDWTAKGWRFDDRELEANHFSPTRFETSVRTAFDHSDEIVWIYSENPRWWSGPKVERVKLPASYEKALRKAR